MRVLSDEAWAVLEPMIEACRPKGKRAPQDLRRTIEAIVRRCQNGAKWRSVPAGLGPSAGSKPAEGLASRATAEAGPSPSRSAPAKRTG